MPKNLITNSFRSEILIHILLKEHIQFNIRPLWIYLKLIKYTQVYFPKRKKKKKN